MVEEEAKNSCAGEQDWLHMPSLSARGCERKLLLFGTEGIANAEGLMYSLDEATTDRLETTESASGPLEGRAGGPEPDTVEISSAPQVP